MKLFLRYLRKYKLLGAVLLLLCVTFVASFSLYGLPLEAVLYPILFSCFFAGIMVAADFIRARAKYKRLLEISKLSAPMIPSLPAADSLEELGYRQVVEALIREAASLSAKADAQYRETVDYFTLWAHQIKLPITAMSLSLQNEDSALSSDLLQISQYVDMVLAFLRLKSESSDYVFREYDLDPIIRHAVAKFSSEFIDRKLRLLYTPVNRRVVTDEKWLLFVIEQILSNALKYTPAGSIRIFMPSERALCIEDTGIGIAPEDLPRIFEKGYTGLNGRADTAASGIGLYLCKQICDRLGASIRATSEVGRGTAVTVTFAGFTEM